MDAYNPRVNDFGRRLRLIREAQALTQIEMARRGVTGEDDGPEPHSFSNHISRVERGEETNPSLEFIERSARGLGLTLSDFFIHLESLQVAQAESISADLISQPNGSGAVPDLAAYLPLNDIGALVASGTAASIAVARSLDSLVAELRAAREQTPNARDDKPGRLIRTRKTG